MIQVGQGTEEISCTAHLVSDDNPAFSTAFDLEDFDNGTVTLLDIPHDFLIDLDRIGRGFLEEHRVRYGFDVRFAVQMR